MRRSVLSRKGLIVDPYSKSPIVGSYVSLLEQVSLASRDDRVPAVVVTSPSRGDGRTTISANLAICASAIGGRRILLVDADFEQPGLSRLFAAADRPGLAEVLAKGAGLDDLVCPIDKGTAFLLPAGRGINACLAAHAGRAAELISQLRSRFDWVIIDSAPVLQSTGACVLAEHATGAVLVLRAGRTRPEVLQAALDELREHRGKVLGTVLNRRRYMIPRGAYRRL